MRRVSDMNEIRSKMKNNIEKEEEGQQNPETDLKPEKSDFNMKIIVLKELDDR